MSKPNVYHANLLQIRPRWTNEPDGDHTECVTWWSGSVAAGYTLAQLQTIQTVFDADMSAAWAQIGATAPAYIGSVITDWTSNTGLQNDSTTTFVPVNGSLGGVALPSQVCILLSYKIALRYRGGHGRLYFPYLSPNVATGPTGPTSAVQTNLATHLATLWTAMGSIAGSSGGPVTQVVYKNRNNPITAQPFTITAQTVSPTFATQRRRLRKVAHK